MSRLLAWLRGEPVAAITGAVGALLEVVAAFHLTLDPGQKAAVMGAIPILLSLIARQTVTPLPGPALLTEALLEAVPTPPDLPPPRVFARMVADEVVLQVNERAAVAARPRSHRGS